MEFANFMILRALTENGVLFWTRLSLIGETLSAYNLLLFSILFGKGEFRRAIKKWMWIMPFVYIVPTILLVQLLAGQAMVIEDPRFIRLGTMTKYFHLSLLIIVITSLVNLENTFRSSAGLERRRLKYTLFGIGAILSFYVYILTHRLLYYVIDFTNVYLMSSVIIVSVTLILYSTAKSNVINGEIYVSRRVIYSSISLIAIGLYTITVALFAQIIRHFDISTIFRLDILVIFLAILFIVIIFYKESYRRKVKSILNRHFKKSKYVYRDEWMVFSTELSKKISVKDISESLLDNLAERLFVKKLSLWLFDENQVSFSLISSRDLYLTNKETKFNDKSIDFFGEKPISMSDILQKNGSVREKEEIIEFLDETKAELLVPLTLASNLIGIISLGQLQTGESYDAREDYNLLKSVAAHAASAINNAKLFEENLKAKELETFNRLSSFIIHDLKNTTSMLSLVAQNAKKHRSDPEFQEDALTTIAEASAKMEKMITNLSTFNVTLDRRQGLDRRRFTEPAYAGPERQDGCGLQFEDIDINEVVGDAVDHLAIDGFTSVPIEKNFEKVPLVSGDSEELYKVVHNLLLNAYEAIHGQGKIQVSTRVNDGQVIFNVSDTGPGILPDFIDNSLFKPFRTTKKKGFGIGLYQCKTIVEAHGGRIEVESEPGVGTTFSVYLPAKRQHAANS